MELARKETRKWSLVLLSFFLVFCLSACEDDESTQPDDDKNDEQKDDDNNNDEDPKAGNKKSTGASANALLSEQEYDQLKVEIQYVKGYKPTQRALDSFKSFLNANVHKSNGIAFKKTKISNPGDDNKYDVSEIIDIEDQNRSVYNEGSEIGVYFLFVNGKNKGDSDNEKTLGIAYRNTSMVIFEETIQGLSDDIDEPERHKLERAVINHEMGHNLGLVDNGSPMQTDHRDKDKGSHCDNDNCLMHWTVKTGDVVDKILTGGNIPKLDQNCQDDLEANGGK